MPALGLELRKKALDALTVAEVGETARFESLPSSRTRANLTPIRLEGLYELAYLRLFVGWEAFLEDVFLRYLCGYVSSKGVAVPAPGTHFSSSLAGAEARLLGGRDYALWHKPSTVAARCSAHFSACPIAPVVLSNSASLEAFAAIRHRIAHGQDDARSKFDAATMALAGRRYRGARPGAFLRDLDRSATPPRRWLEVLTDEFVGLASQIV